MIVGRAIDLRCLEVDDLALIAGWRNQEDVRRHFFDKSMIPVSGQRNWYERYLKDPTRQVFIAVDKSGAPVGMIGLYRISERDRNAEIGSTIVVPRERGIGTEMIRLLVDYAFIDLNMNRVYAYAIQDNEASVKAKLKCGFQLEGVLREAHYANGTFQHVVLLGIVRSDWQRLSASASPD
jgi:RimJ/RimL family protein N-acetyltransferase